MNYLKIFILLGLFACNKAPAVDNRITIVGLYTPSTADEQASIRSAINYTLRVWDNLGISVPVFFENSGSPVFLPQSLGSTSSTLSAQLETAYTSTVISTIRKDMRADVVLIFTKASTDKCGAAQVRNWNNGNGNFQADTNGLDLRDSNTAYIGLINMNCNSFERTAAHELGHIMGAGHRTSAGLYPDSRSFATTKLIYLKGGLYSIQDATVTTSNTDCSSDKCNWHPYYSTKYNAAYGNNEHNNRRTIDITARSVANYMQGEIVLAKPGFLWGTVVDACNAAGETEHRTYWSEGGSNVPIEFYEIWAQQGISENYQYQWFVTGTQTPGFVKGADAYVKVKACYKDQCSELSDNFYLAQYLCDF